MSEEKKSERIIPVAIEDSMRNAFIDYSMSVIIGRALPDVRDGLKPVHRRILYTMNDIGLHFNKPYKKSAKLVGEVLGRFHPHGDTSVYDAMVRMNQGFAMRYPLVDGQGNYGSIDGDPAAAMRYTETRMTSLSQEMLTDIEKNTVTWRPNYDESEQEPEILPSRIPNLLLNGSSGIAVGMATNIPPHNLRDLAKAVNLLIDHPEASLEEILLCVPGPDFPTGGIICGRRGIVSAYATGKGSVMVRCRADIEPFKDSREQIIITEIPYMVNKSVLLQDIARLVNQKIITGVSELRDESDKDGMRIVLELKKGEMGQVILNQLYKHTQLQSSFSCNMLAIKGGRPKVMGIKEMITEWILHRKIVITRATEYDLAKALRRAHILEGFQKALSVIDEVIRVIKDASNRQAAHQQLMSGFGFSEEQTTAILELRLYQLTALEADKIEKELGELRQKIEELRSILADETKILAIIKEDTTTLATKYGDERRSSIEVDESEVQIEDLIKDESCIITLSHNGYIKRVPSDTYRSQKRGGRGVTGMDTRDEDYVEHIFSAMTHDTLMIFTQSGMLHWLKVYKIPEASRVSMGKSIANLLEIPKEDKIAGVLPVRQFSDEFDVVMATSKGLIKKTSLDLFGNVRRKGIVALSLRSEDDQLISVGISSKNDEFFLSSKKGQAVRFPSEKVTRVGRTASGVKGMTLEEGDSVIGMEIISPDTKGQILMVCENGYGKRTEIEEFRITGRGGKGVISIKTSERNGDVVAARVVEENEDIMVITALGMMVRMAVSDISIVGRNAQGVRIINLKGDDEIVGVTAVEKSEEHKVSDQPSGVLESGDAELSQQDDPSGFDDGDSSSDVIESNGDASESDNQP